MKIVLVIIHGLYISEFLHREFTQEHTLKKQQKDKNKALIRIILLVLGTHQGDIIFSPASSKSIGKLLHLKVDVVTKVSAVVQGDV